MVVAICGVNKWEIDMDINVDPLAHTMNTSLNSSNGGGNRFASSPNQYFEDQNAYYSEYASSPEAPGSHQYPQSQNGEYVKVPYQFF